MARRGRPAAVDAIERGQRGQAADRLGRRAPGLRALDDGAPGDEIVEQLREILRVEVFVIVIVDLHHRRVAAGAEALDLDPGKRAVSGDMVLHADALLADFLDVVGAAQHAGRRAAELHMMAPDRRQVEHRIEGRDFEHAHQRHVEHLRDFLDRWLGQPIIVLLLRAPQQRQHRGRLPARRIFGDFLLRPGLVLRREGEGGRLNLGEATNGHA